MNTEEVNAAIKNPETKYCWTISFEPILLEEVNRLESLMEANGFFYLTGQLSILTPGHPEHDHYDL